MGLLDHVTPKELGLPEKFAEFRSIQSELVEFGLYGPTGATGTATGSGSGSGSMAESRRFHIAGAPPGMGKSLASQAMACIGSGKTVTITATLSLQQQYLDDGFPLVNIQGRKNYQCNVGGTCDEGEEHECPDIGKMGCPYTYQVELAREARSVLTNYSYWIAVRGRNPGSLELPGQPVELLICDEAHLAPNTLARSLGAWISNSDFHRYSPKLSREAVAETKGAEWGFLTETWQAALYQAEGEVGKAMVQIAEDYDSEAAAYRKSKKYRQLSKLSDSLMRVCWYAQDEGNWIWRVTDAGVAFDCVWPGRYAEKYLWTGVPRVVLMSATARPKLAELLAIRKAEHWFREWPRVFLPQNNPVVWVPTGKASQILGKKSTAEAQEAAVRRANEIYDEWAPRHKGIVHTPSYKLAEWFQANTRMGRYMMINPRGEAAKTAERFRAANPPCILVSPSYGTGHDFSDEQCEWIHIPKLPFADRSDPVLLARSETDERYGDYECMQDFVQESFRGQRKPTDRCVTIVTDDAVQRFRNYARDHAPRWFRVTDAAEGKVPRAPENRVGGRW